MVDQNQSHLLGSSLVDSAIQNMTTASKINAVNSLIQEVQTDSVRGDADLRNDLIENVSQLNTVLNSIDGRIDFLESQDLVNHPELEQAMLDFLRQPAVVQILASKNILVNGEKVSVTDYLQALANAPDVAREELARTDLGEPTTLTVNYTDGRAHVFDATKVEADNGDFVFRFTTENYLGLGSDAAFEYGYVLDGGFPALKYFTRPTFVLAFDAPEAFDLGVPDTDGDGVIGEIYDEDPVADADTSSDDAAPVEDEL